PLCLGVQLFEINRPEIVDAKPSPSVGHDAFRRWQKCCIFCRFILRHELRSPGNTAKANLGATTDAIIDPDVAVPVGILAAAFRKPSRHYRATFQSLSSGRAFPAPVSAPVVGMTTILPSGEISTRATPRPALTTALTARVTSHCLNVQAPRVAACLAVSPRGAMVITIQPKYKNKGTPHSVNGFNAIAVPDFPSRSGRC